MKVCPQPRMPRRCSEGSAIQMLDIVASLLFVAVSGRVRVSCRKATEMQGTSVQDPVLP